MPAIRGRRSIFATPGAMRTEEALFLCLPAVAWTSGQILTVSGGGVPRLG
ncbi:NAD-dependent 7-alpha-hydroxysteroid dehydrogenase [Oceaniovalibus guishaninsula JLT2003]|uniref:NAD-dependent 7-alpha-hydroxysteroid dehydrogenase n=1 Tax=Oceaniovalibus guishaninsula JLT2003 TaxID=1231392 RepID=K2HAR6_9RHOB|nr:hypothetical protein [Oceaniovalibus guishaninsula]EKE44598.1 NAD-dependent 7-alpha-hydroxysteroid dehydrogenase [Oceaniovalibus guishaninsula JLT2003]